MKKIIILLLLGLAGCGYIGGEDIRLAQEYCKDFGGIRYMDNDSVRCNKTPPGQLDTPNFEQVLRYLRNKQLREKDIVEFTKDHN